jgi:hypothetical protein
VQGSRKTQKFNPIINPKNIPCQAFETKIYVNSMDSMCLQETRKASQICAGGQIQLSYAKKRLV